MIEKAHERKSKKSFLSRLIEGLLVTILGGVIVYMITTGDLPGILRKLKDKNHTSVEATKIEDEGVTEDRFTEPENGSVVVPNLVGMEQNDAADLLLSIGLSFTVWATEDDIGEEGQSMYIINQSIPESSIVSIDTIIRLQVTCHTPDIR